MLHSRERRVAESIKHAISRAFQDEMSDPRLPKIVTVTDVVMSRDLRSAKVVYSQIPDDEDALNAMEDLLEDCAGFLRSCVARDVNTKFCPTLNFVYDPSAKRYQRINSILHQIKEKEQDENSD